MSSLFRPAQFQSFTGATGRGGQNIHNDQFGSIIQFKIVLTIIVMLLMLQPILLPNSQPVALAQRSNQIVYAAGPNGAHQLYVMNADGSNPQLLLASGNSIEPNWSPDRHQIAFTSDQSGRNEIYVINANGSGQRQITEDGGYNPSWSPDGQRLAFISERTTGSSQLFVTDLAGNQVKQLTSDPNAQASAPAWSPDNKTIAFVYNQGGESAIWLIDSNGNHLRQFTHDQSGNDYGTAWSPDGKQLAYISTVAGDSDLLLVGADGKNGRQLVTLTGKYADNITWSEDGQQLAFTAWARHGLRAIFIVGTDGSGNLRQLSQGSDDAGWPSWASLYPSASSDHSSGQNNDTPSPPAQTNASYERCSNYSLPPRLRPGGNGYVGTDGAVFHPSYTEQAGVRLVPGTTFEVVGDPVCANPYNPAALTSWWPVTLTNGSLVGESGWIAESNLKANGTLHYNIAPKP